MAGERVAQAGLSESPALIAAAGRELGPVSSDQQRALAYLGCGSCGKAVRHMPARYFTTMVATICG